MIFLHEVRVAVDSHPRECRRIDSWQASRGDLVILRGFGWPTAEARCVVHGVEPPPAGERVIMTFRHNRGGAGADYFLPR